MKTFYNTIGEDKKTAAKSKQKAATQQEQILELFKSCPNVRFSPSEISNIILCQWPLTSIRRAITNLTDAGLLEKTYIMTIGAYGKPEHTWKLKTEKEEQLKLWK